MKIRPEKQPAAVPIEAIQAGEMRDRWSGVEPSVWTDRMLTALENGVKGGVWYSLMDKVYGRENLEAATRQVEHKDGAAGVDHQTIGAFLGRKEEEIRRLQEQLQDGRYQPQAIRRVYIPKPGSSETRPLGIPTVRDRIVEAAVCNVIEPIWEKEFARHSYGFRPGRGCKDALREVEQGLEGGWVYVVDADLKGYFRSASTT